MASYALTDIPDELHQLWRLICKMKSISMRVYLLKALKKQIELDTITLNERGIDLKKALLEQEKN